METLTVHFTDRQAHALHELADAAGLTAAELARQAVLKFMEDEADARQLHEAMASDDGQRFSLAEVLRVVENQPG